MIEHLAATMAAHQAGLGFAFVVALFAAFATQRLPPVVIAVFGAGVMIALGR